MGVGLGEEPGDDARAEPPLAGVRHRLAGEQPQEVRLARAVGPQDADPVAVPDLEVERLHQAGELQLLGDDRPHAGAPAAQPHRHLLLRRPLRRRPGRLELRQPGLHRVVAVGHVRRVGRLLLQGAHQVDQPLVLLVPAPAQLGQPLVPRRPGLVVAGEAAAVHPRRPALDGDHAVGDAGEQLAVVADEQHGLAGVEQPLLEPPLARDVEVVVRLVEQQHLVGPAQQRLQRQPLLLAARQRRQLAVLAAVVGDAERGDGDGVPGDLGVVAADVAPVRRARGRRPSAPRSSSVSMSASSAASTRVPRLADGGRREVDEEPLDRACRRGPSR